MKTSLLAGASVVVVSAVVITAMWAARDRLAESIVRIEVREATLEGTLYSRSNGASKSPTVVVLHGSGPDGRSNPYYRQLASTFARAGFSTFVYDKRGSGRSSGSWIAVPFPFLADDAVKVVEHLRKTPTVDPIRIVIWGGSEGGSLAPEVAVRTNAFGVIAQSASGVPFWKQNRFQNVGALRRRGLNDDEIEKEMAVHEAAMNFARTGNGWERFSEMRANGSRLPITNERDDPWWRWYGTKLDYEPGPWLRKLKSPLLAVWGAQDVLVPVDESMLAFQRPLSNNPAATLKVFAESDHSLTQNGRPVQLEAIEEWLKALK